jgi:hypothetical protein
MLELDPRIARAISSRPPEPVRAETLSTMRAASSKPSGPPSPGVERRDYIIDREHGVPVARRYIEGINQWIGAQLQDSAPVG